ncbi:MAG: ABC transporter permease [Gemmatimonadaceae bacterium]|nr:ABC transporter permease [Gemmatimonadaceae bacterium]
MRGNQLRRIGDAALLVALVVATCFILIRLAPGDPFYPRLDDPAWTPERAATQRVAFGYDKPIRIQFVYYVSRTFRGDLGWSHSRNQPVAEALASALPATGLLVVTALGIAFAVGILVGAWQGWRRDSPLVRASDRVSLVLLSVPEFLIAVFALMGPALAWRWFPTAGMRTPYGPEGVLGLLDRLHHLALPALALGLPIAAVVARLQASAMREVRDAEFVRAARSRGLLDGLVLRRHALRNALIPVLTYAGLQLSTALSGAVIVERLFSWPGMGRLIVDAVGARDYPLVAGGVLVAALCTVVGTMLADLALRWATPRLRARA